MSESPPSRNRPALASIQVYGWQYKAVSAKRPARASPQNDRCSPQPGIARQLVDNEPGDIGASYLAAIDACEVDDCPDVAMSWVVGEHAGPDDDPIE